MVRGPSWETNSRLPIQAIPSLLWNPKVHYRVHKSPPLAPYPEPDESSPQPPNLFLKDAFEYCPPIYAWVFQVISFCQVFRPKFCMHISSRPCVLHAPLISPSFIWWLLTILKLLIMQHCPASCYLLPLIFTCSPQHPFLTPSRP